MTSTTTLQQSIRLKELGVKQEGEKIWLGDTVLNIANNKLVNHSDLIPYTAFTTDELFRLAPFHTMVRMSAMGDFLAYVDTQEAQGVERAPTPAQALGQLLIRLLEEGVVKASDL